MAAMKRLLGEVELWKAECDKLKEEVKALEEEVAWRKDLSMRMNKARYKYLQEVQEKIIRLSEEGEE